MKKIILFALTFLSLETVSAQCSYTQVGTLSSSINLSSIINCPDGDVVLNNMNSDPGGNGVVIFDTDVSFNSLTINFANGNKPIEFVIPSGINVNIEEDLIFSGQPDKDKFLTVEGDLDVGGTLDFGDVEFEIDGDGGISAGAITGAGSVTCSAATGGTGTCPDISAATCDDGGGGFCTDEPSVTLPIELLFFKSNITNNGVELTWATAKEDNFDYFSVERSRNGKDYEEIAQIKGAGFSRSILNYGFTDTNPLNGKSYYRLNAIDLDLYQEYSQPILVNTGAANSNNISVSPNPLEGTQLSLISENTEEDAKVLIYDMAGVLIRELPYVSGVALDLGSKLKPGIYMVLLSGASSQSKTKLIVR